MARILLLLSALAVGGIAVIIYVDARNEPPLQDDEPFVSTGQTNAAPTLNNASGLAPHENRESETKQPSPAITAKKIAQWIAETDDEDPAVRAAAIDALANAPKSKAFPVLLHVMRSGFNEDRQLALDSLHTLALNQGDENDEIRTALRLVIYDGDDETIISGAQIALEDIEYGLPSQQENKNK